MTATEILTKYKNTKPSVDDLVPLNFEGHPLYWILLRLIHLGTAEKVSVLSGQLGLPLASIKMLIDVTSDEVKILRNGFDRERQEVIKIDPNAVSTYRQAAYKVVPGDMPPETLRVVDPKTGNEEEKHFEFFLHAFQKPDYYPIEEILGLLQATKFFDEAQVIQEEQGLPKLRLLGPDLLFVLQPFTGSENNGYFADRLQILDVREAAFEVGPHHIYEDDMRRGVVISNGFTLHALVAASRAPRILPLKLVSALKLIGEVQQIDKYEAGVEAFKSMFDELDLASENTLRYAHDEFANKTINSLKG